MTIDLSVGVVKTVRTRDTLPALDAFDAAYRVYDEFSENTPLSELLLHFIQACHFDERGVKYGGDQALALSRFDYACKPLSSTAEVRLRTKGIVAVNMLVLENFDGDISAELQEPFVGHEILPNLHATWTNRRAT